MLCNVIDFIKRVGVVKSCVWMDNFYSYEMGTQYLFNYRGRCTGWDFMPPALYSLGWPAWYDAESKMVIGWDNVADMVYDTKRKTMKPGRYYTMRAKALGLPTDTKSVNKWITGLPGEATYDVEIVTDPDTIVDWYNSFEDLGLESCMAKHPHYWHEINPMYVLANHPDIGLALLRQDGKLRGRAIVRLSNKAYARVYWSDDEHSAKSSMFKAGFSFDGFALEGLELDIIRDSQERKVFPFVDGDCKGVLIKGNKAILVHDNDKDGIKLANRTNGYLVSSQSVRGDIESDCHDCGAILCENDRYEYISNHGHVCTACIEQNYVEAICNHYRGTRYVHRDEVIHVEREGVYFSSPRVAEMHEYCQHPDTGEWVRESDVELEDPPF